MPRAVEIRRCANFFRCLPKRHVPGGAGLVHAFEEWRQEHNRAIWLPAQTGGIRNRDGWRPPPATPRHTLPPLRLLPSGSDRVHGIALRGDRRGPP